MQKVHWMNRTGDIALEGIIHTLSQGCAPISEPKLPTLHLTPGGADSKTRGVALSIHCV